MSRYAPLGPTLQGWSKTEVVSSLHQLIPARTGNRHSGFIALMKVPTLSRGSRAKQCAMELDSAGGPVVGREAGERSFHTCTANPAFAVVDFFPSIPFTATISPQSAVCWKYSRRQGWKQLMARYPRRWLPSLFATIPLVVQYKRLPCWYQCMRQGRAMPPLWLFQWIVCFPLSYLLLNQTVGSAKTFSLWPGNRAKRTGYASPPISLVHCGRLWPRGTLKLLEFLLSVLCSGALSGTMLPQSLSGLWFRRPGIARQTYMTRSCCILPHELTHSHR